LLRYLVRVGEAATADASEQIRAFRLPKLNATYRTFMTAAAGMLASPGAS